MIETLNEALAIDSCGLWVNEQEGAYKSVMVQYL